MYSKKPINGITPLMILLPPISVHALNNDNMMIINNKKRGVTKELHRNDNCPRKIFWRHQATIITAVSAYSAVKPIVLPPTSVNSIDGEKGIINNNRYIPLSIPPITMEKIIIPIKNKSGRYWLNSVRERTTIETRKKIILLILFK